LQAISFSNLYAPEHLIINVKDAEQWEELVENAGRYIFIIRWCGYIVLHADKRSVFISWHIHLEFFILIFGFHISGSVFLGQWTPESVGDYASGTNHVLPTYGYARMYSGVSLNSFLKYITVQSLTEEGLRKLGPYVAKMAEVEGLEAHKRAVTLRLQEVEASVTV